VAERLLRALTVLLVLGVAGLAFVVSFEAISAFAVTTGAFQPALGWCAPLLVDTFRIVCLTRGAEGFDFLGFHHHKVESWKRRGRFYLQHWPSAKPWRRSAPRSGR
jgi:hypothetical protein